MRKRTLVVGDIHGAYIALRQVLERARVTSNDTLIFLGDYVDGWGESAEVISFLANMQHEQHCVFIKGNHDTWCEDWLKTGDADTTWLSHGGKNTVMSYASLEQNQRIRHIEFFAGCKLFEIDGENRLFIHAGFTSMHGPEKEFHSSNYRWDRTLWEMALAMDIRISKDSILYPKRLKMFSEIYIGHTPTINYDVDVPMNVVNVWNLDTGAAFTGKLSIMDIESKQFWQSDQVALLYPGETGRTLM